MIGGELDQRRIVLQRGAQERLGRQEHHDELGRRGGTAPSRSWRRGRVTWLADLTRVLLQVGVAEAVVGGLERVEIGEQRRLGVDDQLASARKLDDQIGRAPAVVGGDGAAARGSRSAAACPRARRRGGAASRPSGRASLGVRSARTRLAVSPCSCCCVAASDRTLLGQARRMRADAVVLDRLQLACPTRSSESRIGFTSSRRWRCRRCSRSPAARCWTSPSAARASVRNAWLLCCSASAESAWNGVAERGLGGADQRELLGAGVRALELGRVEPRFGCVQRASLGELPSVRLRLELADARASVPRARAARSAARRRRSRRGARAAGARDRRAVTMTPTSNPASPAPHDRHRSRRHHHRRALSHRARRAVNHARSSAAGSRRRRPLRAPVPIGAGDPASDVPPRSARRRTPCA